MDRSASWARLRAQRVARLATVSAAGQPHLVPVTFAVAPTEPVVVIAVDHKPKTTTALRRLRNIAENERVSLLADEYDEDWTRLWWARFDGAAAVFTEGTEHRNAIDWLTTKYEQYRRTPPSGPVVRIVVDAVRGWSYTD
ncbi:TIGR03668 family PPOX class F420-dependent oxidoreductase [Nocardia sp. CDC159]|uniref:TIGR03668 family PPOX class F420-dependent oxidoreductase n=1 Tax=Nocardia pulmonis TaxID=2951408 RepID=A0A9X2E5F5_9NOCA|nr:MULTISPECIES: TIGR03668 family PPOX class F420-dependent oxidoreductase [Nocardia]MCM6774139.1 TIGR03668 family PPOX class F420-dependent oxidoreductase [Nocardia pulmonis]MCM6787026.1 TIGR03668 family PPOX class F420-dependent oxidoreductase [Nocardia sp. CDC159]